MKRKMMYSSIILGTGLGYWLFREFQKSDHTYSGMLTEARRDINTATRSLVDSTKRCARALQAAVRDFQERSELPYRAPKLKQPKTTPATEEVRPFQASH